MPPADTALVSSRVDFTGNTVGLAGISTMCSRDSGAVNQVRGHRPALPPWLELRPGEGQTWN